MSQQTYYREKTGKAGLQPKMSPQPGQSQKKSQQLKQLNAKIPSKAVEALLDRQASVTNNAYLEENRPRDQNLGRDDELNVKMSDVQHNVKNHSGSAQPTAQSQVFNGNQAHGLLGRTLAAIKSSSVPNVAVAGDKVTSNGKVSSTAKQINKRTTRSDMIKQQSSHEPSPPNASTKCSSSEPHLTDKQQVDTITSVAINRQFKNEAVDQVHSNERGPRGAQKTRQRHQLKLETKNEEVKYMASTKDNPTAESALNLTGSWAMKASPIGKKPTEHLLNSGNKEALPARTFDESREDEIIRLIEAHQRERLQIDPMRELEEALMDRTTASLNRRQKPQQLNKNSQVTTSGVEDHSIISPTFIHIDFSREVPLQTITQAEAERFQEIAQLRAEQAAQEAASKEGGVATKLSFVSVASVKDQRKKSERNEDQANSSSDQDLNSGTLRRKRVKSRLDIGKLQQRERIHADHMPRKARRMTNQQDNGGKHEQQIQEIKGIDEERDQDSHTKMYYLTRHINEWNYVQKGRGNNAIGTKDSHMQHVSHEDDYEAKSLGGYDGQLRYTRESKAKFHDVEASGKEDCNENNQERTLTDEESMKATEQQKRRANVTQQMTRQAKKLESSPVQTKKDREIPPRSVKSIHESVINQSQTKRRDQEACHLSNEQMKNDLEMMEEYNDESKDTCNVRHERIEDAAKLVDSHFERANEMQFSKKRSAKFHQKRQEVCSRVEHFVNSAVIDDQIFDEKTTPNQFGKTFKKQKSGGGLLPPQIASSDVIQDAHEIHNRTMATEDIQAVYETEQRNGERCPATDSSEQFSSNILAETTQMQNRKGRFGGNQAKAGDSKDFSDVNRISQDDQEARQRAETFGKSQHDVSFASPQATNVAAKIRMSQMRQSAQQSPHKLPQGKYVRQARSIRAAKAFAANGDETQTKGGRKRQNVCSQHVKQMQENDETKKTTQGNHANTPQQQQQFNQNNRCAEADQIHESAKQNKTSRQQLDQFAGHYSHSCMMQLQAKYLRRLPPPANSLAGFAMGLKQVQKLKKRRSSVKAHLSEQSHTLHKLMTLTNVVNVCQMQYIMQLQMQQQYAPFMASYQYNFSPFSQHSWNMFTETSAAQPVVEDFGPPQQDEVMQVDEQLHEQAKQDADLKEKQAEKKESLHATLKRLLGPTDGWSSRPVHCNEMVGLNMNNKK